MSFVNLLTVSRFFLPKSCSMMVMAYQSTKIGGGACFGLRLREESRKQIARVQPTSLALICALGKRAVQIALCARPAATSSRLARPFEAARALRRDRSAAAAPPVAEIR